MVEWWWRRRAMSTVVADADLQAKWNGMNKAIAVQSPVGEVLGRFIPEDEFQKMQYELAKASCPFSDEELERRSKETGGTSLAELWKRMGIEPSNDDIIFCAARD
jgi:hypothetical protein